MDNQSGNISPQVYARIGGLLYLIVIVVGGFSQGFVRSTLIVSGDATATARNILASETLWRASIAGELFMLLCAIGLLLVFYVLLRPVSNSLSLLGVFFNLLSISLEASNKLYLLAVSPLLSGTEYLKGFEPQQLQILAYLSIKSHTNGFHVSLIFFGCAALIFGYLIFKSAYLPRALGIMVQVAGVSYLTGSFASLFIPTFSSLIYPAILLPAFVGELSFCLWLLLKGINVERWTERVNA